MLTCHHNINQSLRLAQNERPEAEDLDTSVDVYFNKLTTKFVWKMSEIVR